MRKSHGVRKKHLMINHWKIKETGDTIALLTPKEFEVLEDGAELYDIFGQKFTKGADKIDQDTRCGFIAFGKLVGKKRVQLSHEIVSISIRPHNLKEAREASGMTLRKLADKCGLSVGFLNDLEFKRRTCSQENFNKIKEALR